MKYVYIILFSLVLLTMIFFAYFNDQMVTLKLWGLESVPMPLFAIIYIGALLVVVLMSFVGISEKFRLKGEIRRLKKETKTLRAELDTYKDTEVVSTDVMASEGSKPDIEGKGKPKAKKKKFSFTKKTKKEGPESEVTEDKTEL